MIYKIYNNTLEETNETNIKNNLIFGADDVDFLHEISIDEDKVLRKHLSNKIEQDCDNISKYKMITISFLRNYSSYRKYVHGTIDVLQKEVDELYEDTEDDNLSKLMNLEMKIEYKLEEISRIDEDLYEYYVRYYDSENLEDYLDTTVFTINKKGEILYRDNKDLCVKN